VIQLADTSVTAAATPTPAANTQHRPNKCVSSCRSAFHYTGRVGGSPPDDQPERDVERCLDTWSDKLAPNLNPQVLGSSPRGRTD
jgi:hypothetical protein